jgi:O-antigen biosynthesis protein WbqV
VLKINNRANIAFVHDVVMAAASFLVALFLRLGDNIQFYPMDQLIYGVGLFTAVAAVVFRFMNMYRGVWRYASLNDLLNIIKSASLVILIFLGLLFVTTRLEDLPRSLPFINWFVVIALLGAPRFAYRLFKDHRLEFKLESNIHQRIPVLLVGAGDSAELFIRDLARGDSNYRVSGIVSGNLRRVGRDIHGVEILGTIDQITEVFESLSKLGEPPQRLIITSEQIKGAEIKTLLDTAEALGMTMARLPSLTDFKKGIISEGEVVIHPIDVEDLLGRPQLALDRTSMEALILGKRILITGAGGSIGSELVRQISDLAPASIAMIENSEFNLYNIDMELSKRHADLRRHAFLGDVRDSRRIGYIFDDFKPELVFHAAAFKHVPIVESNMLEGLSTNILGTMNVANAAEKSGVATFVQISTDKAVNPTNVMGASKRIAESFCQALDATDGPTRFVTVRFGNVLGSTGSVVELFKKQISDGGPVTVTDPEIKRYFMTAREAVELVLAASALGSTQKDQVGKIYVLDMGDPVFIRDLAKQMIRLAGYTPEKDIKIIYTGLRAGEKLFEEIFHNSEKLEKTLQSGILLAAPRINSLVSVMTVINAILEAIDANDFKVARAEIFNLVPEYNPPQNN